MKKQVTDCKVIVSEFVAKQRSLLVWKSKRVVVRTKRAVIVQPRIHTWKLCERDSKEKFQN